ncbi:MAG: response regulator transcription factor [Proteobacteria bacterium]|nr:response regulator transcription factor [Pseudomonadota bacterium]
MHRVTEDKPHILVVDDDQDIRRLIGELFDERGYRVTAVADGASVTRQMVGTRFDLAILDVMLPGEDGFDLCRRIRKTSRMPIIMLTARGDETDRVVGLEIGADDYVSKPFSPRELLARVRAVLRRTRDGVFTENGPNAAAKPRLTRLIFDGWIIDTVRRELRAPNGSLVSLTATEFDLLFTLAERATSVVSRDDLLDLVRGRTATPFDRSIDVCVSRLRKKIETIPDDPRIIRTVRNIGYVFSAPVTPEWTTP